MNNESLGNVEHSVLAYYGIELEPGSIELIYNKALDWMSRFGCVPDLMGTNHDTGKYIPFAKSKKKLLERGFVSLTRFEICTLAEGAANAWEGTKGCIYFRGDRDRNALVITFQSNLVALGSPQCFKMAEEACALSNPRYGIGYRRKMGLGPLLYALGISYGRSPARSDSEDLRISHWGTAVHRELYDRGLLRDVYSWNFLTSPQLNSKVDNLTLQQWIQQDPCRGALGPLTETVTLWAVKNEHLPKVRDALFEANVIFDYEKHIRAPLVMFNHACQSVEESREFTYAWLDKSEEEFRHWYREKYGRDKGPPRSTTGEQVVQDLLRATGATAEDVEVLKVEKLGKTRKLSKDVGRKGDAALF